MIEETDEGVKEERDPEEAREWAEARPTNPAPPDLAILPRPMEEPRRRIRDLPPPDCSHVWAPSWPVPPPHRRRRQELLLPPPLLQLGLLLLLRLWLHI